jgi:hypothetical protein
VDYRSWQKYREEMKQREIKERQGDVLAPRPPINASVTDQALRDLLDRVAALEASQTLKAFSNKS